MATTKTTTLTFRIEPNLKEALRMAADREHRSIANMIGVMIRDHCGQNGITIHSSTPPTGSSSAHQPPRARNRRQTQDAS
jgi:hypothetical protein